MSATTKPTRQPSMAVSVVFLFVCTMLWLAFGAVLLIDPSRLLDAWDAVRGQPLIVEILAWVLLLPWMFGLWVWQSDWATWTRVALLAALAAGMIFAFLPRPQEPANA